MNAKKRTNQLFQSKSTVLVFVLLFIASSILFRDRNFLSSTSVLNLLRKCCSDGGLLALGMAFVIIVGQIDLSVGSVMALGGVVMGMVGANHPILGILLGLACGVVCGMISGFMVAKMRLSSWVATLAMMLGIRAMVLLMTNQKPVSISNPVLAALGGAKIFGVNILVILFFVLTFVCMFVGKYTRFGMALYAVGGNEEAARMMGLKVDKVKIAAYTICGTFAALAGMLLASRLYTAQPTAGTSWETTAIAMCALGGIKLTGGEGRFSGAFFGILIVSLINTIFNYIGSLNSWWQNIVMGILILISIGLQSDVLREMLPFKKKAAA